MNIPAHIAARGARRYMTGRQQSTWLITFADMAILMVAFFAVIISFSHFNPRDFTSLSDAMGERFGGKKSGNALVAILPATHNTVGEAVLSDLAKQFEPLLANAAIQMQQSPQRIVITLGAAGFFQSGSAELDQRAVEALTRMGQIAGTAPIEVTVEGHADSKPVSGGRYRDNWELAAARSATVLKILAETSGLPAGSFKIVSYGASRPTTLETDTATQARNRRVDIEIRYR